MIGPRIPDAGGVREQLPDRDAVPLRMVGGEEFLDRVVERDGFVFCDLTLASGGLDKSGGLDR